MLPDATYIILESSENLHISMSKRNKMVFFNKLVLLFHIFNIPLYPPAIIDFSSFDIAPVKIEFLI